MQALRDWIALSPSVAMATISLITCRSDWPALAVFPLAEVASVAV